MSVKDLLPGLRPRLLAETMQSSSVERKKDSFVTSFTLKFCLFFEHCNVARDVAVDLKVDFRSKVK